jgi:hypothetical protein
MRFKFALAALAATAVFASPAQAQLVSATTEARGTILQPLTLTQMEDLDFGTVLSSAVAGTVSIDADTGGRTVTGGVTAIVLDVGQRAEFAGVGTLGQLVEITLVPPPGNVLNRVGGGATITVNQWDLDGGAAFDTFQTRTITDPDGAFLVGVGAEFNVAANQMNGLYTANFDVTAEYQ